MARARAGAALVAVFAAGVALVSGGSSAGSRTPAALPGLPPPFLGLAVLGDGGATAAVDAYGDVVDLRPAPAGPALIENPAGRQAAGTVPAATGVVPRLRRGGAALPPWRADSVSQRYLPRTNVLLTTARFGAARLRVTAAASGARLALAIRASGPGAGPGVSVDVAAAAPCRRARPGSGSAAGSGSRSRSGWDAGATLTLVCEVGRRSASAGASGGAGAAAGASAGGGASAGAAAWTIAGGGGASAGAAARTIAAAARGDRRWLARARPLTGAPVWARRLYARSLLTLRALTAANGAVAAGARDGWAYVWPRDAGAVALAFAAAGRRAEARRVAGFLDGLDLGAAARFHGDATPVPGRAAQGDAAAWVAVAQGATQGDAGGWRHRSDYQEKAPGDYLGNAIAAATGAGANAAADGAGANAAADGAGANAAARGAGQPHSSAPGRAPVAAIARLFTSPAGLLRRAGDPASGVDSAAAWAVRPFPLPSLFPAARRSLRQLLAEGGRFGIVPSADWPEADPWTAPTAWSAWAFAALARADRTGPSDNDDRAGQSGWSVDGPARRPRTAGRAPLARPDRRAALALLADLRRAATPLSTLPERLDAHSGVPRSTTPLAWSHAFAILALRELWPGPRR